MNLKRFSYFYLFFVIICCLLINVGLFMILQNNKPCERSQAGVSSYSNTHLNYSNQFQTSYQIPAHYRYDYSSCAYAGTSHGTWTSSSDSTNISVYRNNVYIKSMSVIASVSSTSLSQCPYCGSKFSTVYYKNKNISAYIPVNDYGDYSLIITDGLGAELEKCSVTHFWKGSLNLDKNGGSGGISGINVASNALFRISSLPSKPNYKFNGYYSNKIGGTCFFTATGEPTFQPSAFPANLTDTSITLYAQWTKTNSNIFIEPNGGLYNGDTGSAVLDGEIGSEVILPIPSREGYTFEGWMSESGDAILSSFGALLWDNTFFDKASFDGGSDYNNEHNGNVRFSYESPDADLNWGAQKNVLKITTVGPASPGLGGFYHNVMSSANAILYQVIYAKLPLGYSMELASNSIGDGSNQEFLTAQQGTGNWEMYIIKRQCGNTGTFSTTGHVYLNGPVATAENPVSWSIAYLGLYDGTKVSTENRYDNTMVTFGERDTYIRAIWREDSWATHYVKPMQNANGVYEVNTAAELGYFAFKTKMGETSDSIILKNDIDLSGHYWKPIGFANNYDFSGRFDGQGFTISHMNIAQKNANYVGLFGFIDSNSIQNPIIENVTITKSSVIGQDYVGGIAGFSWRGMIRNCSFLGEIMAVGSQVGGIVGCGYHNTEVANCFVDGNIQGLESVGGIMGAHQGEGTALKNCFFAGQLTGARATGGIVGCDYGNYLNIITCGVNADIVATEQNGFFGGIIGKSVTIVYLQNCFSVIRFQNVTEEVNDLLGAVGDSRIEFCYVVAKKGQNQYMCMYGNIFENWAYSSHINDGYPVPKGLFYLGGVGNQNVYQYMLEIGFVRN